MEQENWQQVRDIFVDVVQQKPEIRQALLEQACDDKGKFAVKSNHFCLLMKVPKALWNLLPLSNLRESQVDGNPTTRQWTNSRTLRNN